MLGWIDNKAIKVNKNYFLVTFILIYSLLDLPIALVVIESYK